MSILQLTSQFNQLRRHPGYRHSPARVLWRAAAWSLHCLLGIPARARFRRWNFRLYLPPKWRGGGCTSPYLFREFYEPELLLLERFLKPGMVFVDGGANTGVFTCTAARLVGPTGRVMAFEPGAACFQSLRRSVALNHFEHVQVRQQALSNQAGTARLYHHAQQENSFSLGAAGGVPFEEISTTTLDEAAEQEHLPSVDFIKLDVEGAEELVLRGALNVIEKYRPVVLFEVNPDAAVRLNLAVDGACRLLADHNYSLVSMQDDGKLSPIVRQQGISNVLAIPKESGQLESASELLSTSVT